MSMELHVYTRQGVVLADALRDFDAVIASYSATAILYTPRRCELAVLSSQTLWDSCGQAVDTCSVFEARVFCEEAELRWLNDPSPEQCHRAVILTEQDHGKTLLGWEPEQQRPAVIETLTQKYLLWGEGTGQQVQKGWSELATARIGRLRIPEGGIRKNQRVLLSSLEYIAEADFGNAMVYDERLVKLEVADG